MTTFLTHITEVEAGIKRLIISFLLVALLLISGCAGNSTPGSSAGNSGGTGSENQNSAGEKGTYQKISAEDAKMIMFGKDPFILLDVRSDEEYREQRIVGAELLPVGEIKDKAASQLPDKNATIIVYCRSGARSAQAAQTLIDLGYTKVYDLGGIIDWPYGTEKD